MKKIIPNITYKSVLDRIKDIDKRNKAFHELDPESQRMEIAWDCLNLLTNKTIKAHTCGYWSDDLHDVASGCSTAFSLHRAFNKSNKIKNCAVCARGAMMLSQIRLGNSIEPDDDYIDRGVSGIIYGFGYEYFLKMEREYESNEYGHPYQSNTEEKLANICCNILVNGNFNTKDKTDYLIVKG